jgi:hypothetical protein
MRNVLMTSTVCPNREFTLTQSCQGMLMLFVQTSNIIVTANLVLARMIEWFSANRLVLNLEKTNILKFVTNNLPYCVLTIGHKDKYIEEAVHLKFLGMQIDNHLN